MRTNEDISPKFIGQNRKKLFYSDIQAPPIFFYFGKLRELLEKNIFWMRSV